jgi:glycosyltransferase involved in cell wall biosynthesis
VGESLYERMIEMSPSQVGVLDGRSALTIVQTSTAPIFLTWFLVGHVRALRAAGHSVHAISAPGPELERFSELTGATTHAVEMERNIRLSPDVRALRQFIRLLREIQPDIVHAHTPKAGLLATMAAFILRIPVRVYHCHGLRYETARPPLRAVLWGAERMACGLATQVLTVSPSLRDALVQARLVRESKVEVLLAGSIEGVDGGRFRPASVEQKAMARASLGIPVDARVIGYVGRLVRDKGVVELYHAWRLVRGVFGNARLVLVGPLEDGDPVPPEVMAGLHSDPRVHFVGYRTDTLPCYQAMDVVALPTHREGFGVVNLEAAAMALPVVATRVKGCIDAVVDGVTGTLVPSLDPDRLSTALARYLSDAGLRARHGEQGRARALEHFKPEAYWAALTEGYARWTSGAGVPPVARLARHGEAPRTPLGVDARASS